MPVHTTLDPIDEATRAVDRLLNAIRLFPPKAAATAFKSALTRHGRELVEAAGPDALDTVLAKIRAEAPDKAAAEEREGIVTTAWEGLTQKDRAA